MFAYRRIALSYAGGLFTEIINRIIPILLIHFVATRLGVDRFGYAQVGMQITDLAVLYVIAGFHTVAAIDIGSYRDNPRAIGAVAGEVVALKLFHALSALAFLVWLVFSTDAYREFAPIVLALSFLLFTTAFDLSFVNVGTQKIFALSIITVSAKILSLVAVIYVVIGPEDAIWYAVLSFGANGLVSIANIIYNLRKISLVWPRAEALVRRIKVSFPYAMTFLLLAVLDRFDLFVVEANAGLQEAGLYAAASRIHLSIVNVLSALSGVFFAEMVASSSDEQLRGHVRLTLIGLGAILLPIILGTWFVDRSLLSLIAGPDFTRAGPVLSILLISSLGQMVILVFGQLVLQVKRRSTSFNGALAVGLLISMALVFWQIRVHAILGVAWGLCVGKACIALMILWLTREYIKGLDFGFLLRLLSAGLLMVVALLVLDSDDLWLNLLVGGGAYAIGCLLFVSKELKKMKKHLLPGTP